MTCVDVQPDRLDVSSSGLGAADAQWIVDLRGGGGAAVAAAQRLHRLLLGAAHHQINSLRHRLPGIGEVDIEDLAQHAADDALVAVLRRLDTFEGRSSFSTWAYKFGILHAGAMVRRQGWRQKQVPLGEDEVVPDRAADPQDHSVATDMARAVQQAMDTVLTPHQRRVASALLIQDVPIDLLSELLGSNRNTLYKTLHDARQRLRAELMAGGFIEASPDRSQP